MSKLVLYTTHCPKCKVIETKLKNKGVEFDVVDDPSKITEKGISSVPVLEVDGEMKQFLEANKYVNSL